MRPSILTKITPLILGITAIAAGPGLLFAQSSTGPDTAGITVLTVGTNSGALTRFHAPSYEAQDGGPQNKMHGAPKIGEATAVFNISQAGALLDWAATVWNKGPATADARVRLADQNYNIKRGLDMGACVITGIEFPELKASDGKKHFEVTAKLQPESLKFVGGGGRLSLPGKPSEDEMLPENFSVTMPGMLDEWIVSISLPKITPKIAKEQHGKAARQTPIYGAPDLGTLTIEIAPEGILAASEMAMKILQDGNSDATESLDILIDMKDQSLKTTLGTFTLIGCGLKKFNWAPKLEGGKEGLATATMEFMVEDFRFTVAHK